MLRNRPQEQQQYLNVRQGIPQYNDFRHKMSRKSAQHRVKRNQQMIEAQRLLESHTMSKHSSDFEKTFREGRDRVDEICEELESHKSAKNIQNMSSLLSNFENETKDREALNWPSEKERKESFKIISGTSSIQSDDAKKRYTQNDEVVISTREGRGEIRREKETLSKQKIGAIGLTSECGKIQQLKRRMNLRREQRRQRICGLHKQTSVSGNGRRNIMGPIEIKGSDLRHDQEKIHDNLSDRLHLHYPSEKKSPFKSNFEQKRGSESQERNEFQSGYVKDNPGSTASHHKVDISQGFGSRNKNDHPVEGKQYMKDLNEEASDEESQYGSVVSIELIYCKHCNKSYAPATYEKFCNALDENGNPKCLSLGKTKRKVFNSAKMRITNNAHLQPEEQRIVISGRKKVVSELRQKSKGKKSRSKRSDKWRQQSEEFREAMKCNRLVSKAQREGKPAHYYL